MSNKQLKLSVLDMGIIYHGDTIKESLEGIIKSVQHADSLHFHRYWFAEHHNTEHQISMSPDLMTAIIAGKTNTIRVGAGGVMLPNHSALNVAERFTILESLYPGRIDLALGRAPGTDPTAALALSRTRNALREDDFPKQLDDLLHYFHRDFPSSHPYRNIKISPESNVVPDIFMLGSSETGVQFALDKGLPFAYAAHINPSITTPVMNYYQEEFKRKFQNKNPYSIVSLAIIVAETDEEAAYLAKPLEMLWVKLLTGTSELILVSPEEAANYTYTPQEAHIAKQNTSRIVSGGIDKVEAYMRKLAEETNVDEIMMVDYYPNRETKNKALSLLAERFNLSD